MNPNSTPLSSHRRLQTSDLSGNRHRRTRSFMPPPSAHRSRLWRSLFSSIFGWRKLMVLIVCVTLAFAFASIRAVPRPLADWFSPLLEPLDSTGVVVNTTIAEPILSPIVEVPVFDPKEVDSGSVSPPVMDRAREGKVGRVEVGTGNNEERPGRSSPPERRKPLWMLPPDEALVYAKKEIENAPLISDDPDLHAPLFRNISVFKRSYELMEKILKVYIYRDGARPIFHTPQLSGIYASEGWFMKLMVESKQFVASDPMQAHLFYLPYSARQLQLALYVPGSHNMRPLSLFLKDYVNTIAAKYPFWNRTHGADHFLVACHDWGPYTVVEHEELFKNTIKALCNADSSEKIFKRGRDVSLPETNVRSPRRPLKRIGGKPVSRRSILAFYAGGMHGPVRPILSEFWDGKDENMKIYGPLPNRVSKVMSYIEHMKSSKFCICPMGYEVNSPRIVEAIYYECVPVIIADNLVPPLDEVLDWSKFAIFVEQKDIPNLKKILLSISLRRYISMHRNIQRLQRHFLWHAKPVKYDLFYMILHSIWFNRLNDVAIPQ